MEHQKKDYRIRPRKKWNNTEGGAATNIIILIIVFFGLAWAYQEVPEFKEIVDGLIYSSEVNDPLDAVIFKAEAVDERWYWTDEKTTISNGGTVDSGDYDHIDFIVRFNLAKAQYSLVQNGQLTIKLNRGGTIITEEPLDLYGESWMGSTGWLGIYATLASGAFILSFDEGEHTISDNDMTAGTWAYSVQIHDAGDNLVGYSPDFTITIT